MTELTWEGKYKDGKKVTPVRIALPFQTIETVNESAQQRQKTLDFVAAEPTVTYDKEWRNRLIWGDKRYVLPSLLPEFAGKVNLIYVDPPFNVGSDFSFTATIADHPDSEDDEATSFVKEPSIIEQKAYRDTWGKGLDSYMQWFFETVLLLKELLTEDGSIYVHLDWHVGHYAKTILDEVFGYENFRNEIVWKRTSGHSDSGKYGNSHDVVLYYSKTDKPRWNQPYQEYDEGYVEQYYRYKDPDGRKWMSGDLGAAGLQGGGYDYVWKGIKRIWRLPESSMKKLDEQKRVFYTKNGIPRIKRYLDESQGLPAQDIWSDIESLRSWHKEKGSYATQKPESLLGRIIKTSSNEKDLVLDCFAGSGTTAVVSEKLNRRWITCDLGRFAIHTARKRLLEVSNIKPFVVQNLGKYERQEWMRAEFANPEDRLKQEKDYRHFILELYHAKTLDGYTWLHGSKAGKMIHVGGVETPVTVDDIKATIKEFWKMVGKEKSIEKNHIDFLGWDFAFDVNETAKQFAAENNIQIHPIKIPREVLEKKAVDQGDIKFYELASLSVKTKVNKLGAGVTLENFIIPPDDVPEDVQNKVTHWSQWIDYWAIDWNYKDDTFHNEWQSYRTKQNSKLDLAATHAYESKGKYTVLVKVIDILGNDTTKAIQLTI